MNTYIIRALVLSILRKNAHLPLLIALTPPILLSTALLSLPSMSGIVELLDIRDTSTIVVLDKPAFHNCYSASLVETTISSLGFSTVALLVDQAVFNNISSTISAKPVSILVNEGVFASLPEDLYFRLGKPVKLEMVVQGAFPDEVQVGYVHRLISAPIVIAAQNITPQVYICISNKHSILRNMIANIEKNFFTHVRMWVAFLTMSYVPIVYIASRIVFKRVSSELGVLINLGLDPSRLGFYASLSLLVIASLIIMFLYSLAIAALYTTYSFISTVMPFASPQPGIQGVLFALLTLALCYPLFYISARGSIRFER